MRQRERVYTLTFVSITLAVLVSSFLVIPQRAHAQFADTIGGPVIAKTALKLSIDQALWTAAAQGLVNSITLFTRQFAYDLAVGLASGAKGQNPLAFLSDPGKYGEQLAQDALGEFIGTFSQGTWESGVLGGLNLCKPQVPQVALNIQLGLLEGVLGSLPSGSSGRAAPKCQWQQIANNWNNVYNQVQDPNFLLSRVALQFKPGQSDISVALRAESALNSKISADQLAGQLKRLEGNGILPKEATISGQIETPAAVTKKSFEELAELQDFLDGEKADAKDLLNATMGSDVWVALGKTVLSTFTNTLSQKLMQNVLGGLFQLAKGTGGSQINLNNLYALNPQALEGRQAARETYSSLLVSNIKNGGGIDMAAQFATCPQNRDQAGIYNCVIDPQLSAAIQQADSGKALTLREAVDQRFMDKTKPFGFVNPTSGKEPDVLDGYAYSNMKKLRIARVIPVGWELAAERAREIGTPITLGDVIQAFDKTESPFFGLVDPDWVLKSPPAQCSQLAAGTLVDQNGSRMESCIDLKNCVQEDERGNCKAWGYCTKEKRVWSVGGDSCPAQYASCQTYQNALTNNSVSFLSTTLDSTSCTAENAGCRWYSTRRDRTNPTWDTTARLYLNGQAQTCAATAAGCTEFTTAAANPIQNSGFERTQGTPASGVEGWGNDVAHYASDTTTAFEGRAAVRANGSFSQTVTVEGATQYSFSAYGKGNGSAVIGLTGGVSSQGTTCTPASNGLLLSFNPSTIAAANAYGRASCVFFTAANATQITITISGGADRVYLDALQLEKGATLTAYREGYGTTASVYLKAPPAWLGCTGEEGESAECRNYARVCRRDEVGCQLYTPTNTDPSLAGVINDTDRCPGECVGYGAYKQEAAAFEGPQFPQYIIPARAQVCPTEDIGCSEFTNLANERIEYYREVRSCELPREGGDAATFVTWEGSEQSGYQIKNWLLKQSNILNTSDSRDLCSAVTNTCANAPEVSCRTNEDCIVNALAQGQATAAAVRPPCTNFILRDAGGTLTAECVDTETNQATCVSGEVGTDPDCRGFYDAAGNIFYRRYSRTVLVTQDCSFSRITGTGTQLDEGACLKLGGAWNASALKKCSVAPSGQAQLSTNAYDEVSCAYGRGTWRPDRNECVYAIYSPESRSCSAASLGCREFTGNAGNNVRTVMPTESFESGIGTWHWSGSDMVQSAEAINPGGYAARVTGNVSHDVELVNGQSYTVDFWAKGNGTVLPRFLKAVGQSSGAIPLTTRGGLLTNGWQRYSFGPVKISFESTQAGQIAFDLSGLGARMYLDNVTVKMVSQSLTLVDRSTKNIPISCDSVSASLGGAYSPQYMLGCAEYKDGNGAINNLKSFSRFCRDTSVNCTDVGNTHNSTKQFGSTVNVGNNTGTCRGVAGSSCCFDNASDSFVFGANQNSCPTRSTFLCDIAAGATACNYGVNPTRDLTVDNVAVAPHERNYLVVNTAGTCKQEEKGCQALGLQTANAWETVYYKNLPDNYDTILCRAEENGCAAWSSGSGTAYFKAPTGNNECVWKDTVTIGQANYNGWFKSRPSPVPGIRATSSSTTAEIAAARTSCEGQGRWNGQISVCLNADGQQIAGVTTQNACEGAKGQWDTNARQCLKENLPCYGEVNWTLTGGWQVNQDPTKTYLIGGRTFGVWKNIDAAYRGNIASCPAEQNGCRELVDRNDCPGGDKKNCAAYYVKDNDQLDKQTCREQNSVAIKDGCVLFDDTANPNKAYNTALSYTSGHLTSTAPNDANLLLKVRLDRKCAEWLTCRSAASVFDNAAGRFRLVCNSLGRCNELASQSDQGDIGQCSNWVEPTDPANVVDPETPSLTPAQRAAAEQAEQNTIPYERLTRAVYQKRDIYSFDDQEYTGYSIPNAYPVETLQQIETSAGKTRLAAISPCDPSDSNYVKCAAYEGTTGISRDAWKFLGRCSEEGKACGRGTSATATGRCIKNPRSNIMTCIQNPDGSVPEDRSANQLACRAFPTTNSPFPGTAKIKAVQVYANATLCNEATGDGCECDYQKVSYSGLKDFYFSPSKIPSAKVCVGGTANTLPGDGPATGTKIEGESCVYSDECVSGDCRALSKVTQYRGAKGYCLESDLSRSIYGEENKHPCLTWLPSESVVGVTDIYNQYTEAGFQPKPGNDWYCSTPTTSTERTIVINGSNAKDYFGTPNIGGNGNSCGTSGNCGGGDCKHKFNNGGGWCTYPDAAVATAPPPMWAPNPGLPKYRCSGGLPFGAASVCRTTAECTSGSCALVNSAGSACSNDPSTSCTTDSDCGNNRCAGNICENFQRNGCTNDQQCGFKGSCIPRQADGDKEPTDFLGHYVVSDTGTIEDHVIENAWKGPGPIYRTMIESIQVGFDFGDRGIGADYWAGKTVGITDGETAVHKGLARCNFQKGYTGNLGKDKHCFDNASFTIKVDAGRSVVVQPDFDKQGRLTLFRIKMVAPGESDQGSVDVDSIKIALKPGCKQMERIGSQAFTNRVWEKTSFKLAPENIYGTAGGYDVTKPYKPWGAIGLFPENAPYVTDYTDQICPSPGTQWCGKLYGVEQVQQLFPISKEILSWKTPAVDTALRYSSLGVSLSSRPNILAQGSPGVGGVNPYTPEAPQIKPVTNCREDGKCVEGLNSGITIGDKFDAQSLVLGYNGTLQTTMRFYAWAGKEQMPIKRVIVDWHGIADGGTHEYDAGSDNYYRNRRGLQLNGSEVCKDDNGTAPDFGSIKDKSCDNAYFKFQMTYTCSGKLSPFWRGSECPLPDFRSRYGGCCVFSPRAKVVDSWNWCSGAGGYNCSETTGWVPFAGKVMVAPKYPQN